MLYVIDELKNNNTSEITLWNKVIDIILNVSCRKVTVNSQVSLFQLSFLWSTLQTIYIAYLRYQVLLLAFI